MKKKGSFILIYILFPLLVMMTFTTGCLEDRTAGFGVVAGVVVGGALAVHQLTKDSPNNAQVPEPPSDAEPVEIVNTFASALKSRDIESALKMVSESAREKYRPILEKMEVSLPLIADDITTSVKEVEYSGEMYAQISILREESSGKISYPIVLLKETSGNWRIREF